MGGRGSSSASSSMIAGMSVAAFVHKYGIVAIGDRVGAQNRSILKDGNVQAMRDNKEKIKLYLKNESNKKSSSEAARTKKINGISGLNKLERVKSDWESYNSAVSNSIESGSGRISAKKPAETVASVAKKYPRAASYMKARSYAYASNYVKSELGKEAMTAIENGKSHKTAVLEMEREWAKYVDKRKFD